MPCWGPRRPPARAPPRRWQARPRRRCFGFGGPRPPGPAPGRVRRGPSSGDGGMWRRRRPHCCAGCCSRRCRGRGGRRLPVQLCRGQGGHASRGSSQCPTMAGLCCGAVLCRSRVAQPGQGDAACTGAGVGVGALQVCGFCCGCTAAGLRVLGGPPPCSHVGIVLLGQPLAPLAARNHIFQHLPPPHGFGHVTDGHLPWGSGASRGRAAGGRARLEGHARGVHAPEWRGACSQMPPPPHCSGCSGSCP